MFAWIVLTAAAVAAVEPPARYRALNDTALCFASFARSDVWFRCANESVWRYTALDAQGCAHMCMPGEQISTADGWDQPLPPPAECGTAPLFQRNGTEMRITVAAGSWWVSFNGWAPFAVNRSVSVAVTDVHANYTVTAWPTAAAACPSVTARLPGVPVPLTWAQVWSARAWLPLVFLMCVWTIMAVYLQQKSASRAALFIMCASTVISAFVPGVQIAYASAFAALFTLLLPFVVMPCGQRAVRKQPRAPTITRVRRSHDVALNYAAIALSSLVIELYVWSTST